MDRSRRGSHEITRLFDSHGSAVIRYLTARVGRSEAEDLAAETFLIAFQRFATFDAERGTPVTWLFGIATNLVRSHLRQEQRHLEMVAKLAGEDSASLDEDGAADRVDAAAAVRRLAPDLLQLDATDRDILMLMSAAGLEPTEVGMVLGMPPGTVRSRLYRARSKLRHAAGPPDIEPIEVHNLREALPTADRRSK